jgi:hypothetical protein
MGPPICRLMFPAEIAPTALSSCSLQVDAEYCNRKSLLLQLSVILTATVAVGMSGVNNRPDLVWFRHASASQSNTLLLQELSAVHILVRTSTSDALFTPQNTFVK